MAGSCDLYLRLSPPISRRSCRTSWRRFADSPPVSLRPRPPPQPQPQHKQAQAQTPLSPAPHPAPPPPRPPTPSRYRDSPIWPPRCACGPLITNPPTPRCASLGGSRARRPTRRRRWKRLRFGPGLRRAHGFTRRLCCTRYPPPFQSRCPYPPLIFPSSPSLLAHADVGAATP